MKKNKLFVITTMILSAFMFTSCFDPIFNTIRKDVKPEKATVNGDITSIARYTVGGEEYLVLAANGGLRYKKTGNNSHGNWNTYDNLPFSTIHHDFNTNSYEGQQIMKVIADKTHLYLATIQYKTESYIPTSPKLWAAELNSWSTPSNAWVDITSKYSIDLPITLEGHRAVTHFNAFYTNDPNPDKRHAYLRVGDTGDIKYYELKGTNTKPESITAVSYDSSNDTSKGHINSAVWFDGGVKFFNSPVAITNGSASKDADYVYYGKDSDLFYKKRGETSFTKALSAGAYIASLAPCSDAIIIGCGNPMTGGAGGIRKTSLSNGVPGGSLTGFSTNADFQLPAAYMIMTLLNENPEQSELGSALYASITFPGVPTTGNSKLSDKGLWSYYPERGNWNRE